jgi:hypothetical protein
LVYVVPKKVASQTHGWGRDEAHSRPARMWKGKAINKLALIRTIFLY